MCKKFIKLNVGRTKRENEDETRSKLIFDCHVEEYVNVDNISRIIPRDNDNNKTLLLTKKGDNIKVKETVDEVMAKIKDNKSTFSCTEM